MKLFDYLKDKYFKQFPEGGGIDIVETKIKTEKKANESLVELAGVYAIFNVIATTLLFTGLYDYKNVFIDLLFFLVSFLIYGAMIIIGIKTECKGKKTKYILLGLFILANFIMASYIYYIAVLLFAIAILSTIQFFDFKLTSIVSFIVLVLYTLSIPFSCLISYSAGEIGLNLINYPIENIVGIDNIMYAKIVEIDVSSLSGIIKSSFNLEFLAGILALVLVAIICVENSLRGRDMVLEETEISNAKAKSELEANQAKMHIMISQIQPHFIYNTLNSIYYLCDKDPKVAQSAIADFSDYLRENLSINSKNEIVPFKQELSHVKKYLSLEKLRFEEKLNIVYKIDCSSFRVPSLSIQPLVENAVKHGICRKAEGGTVTIIARDIVECFEVIIEDDGVGFDTKRAGDGKVHIGIENTKSRLENLIGAKVRIDSTKGVGTRVVIKIPKENYYEDISG